MENPLPPLTEIPAAVPAVLAERQRQITRYGHTAEADDAAPRQHLLRLGHVFLLDAADLLSRRPDRAELNRVRRRALPRRNRTHRPRTRGRCRLTFPTRSAPQMTLQECKCLSNFNEMLKEHNTEIDITFSIPRDGGPMRAYPKISTSKIESRKRVGPVIAVPTFCPFCGQPYETKAAEPAETATSQNISVATPWRRVDAGAWTVENDEASYITGSAVDCGDGVIALVAIGNRNDTAHDRAITAIAAVPELIGALEYVLPLVVGMEDRIDRTSTETPWGKVAERAIRQALVKAGGRSA